MFHNISIFKSPGEKHYSCLKIQEATLQSTSRKLRGKEARITLTNNHLYAGTEKNRNCKHLVYEKKEGKTKI